MLDSGKIMYLESFYKRIINSVEMVKRSNLTIDSNFLLRQLFLEPLNLTEEYHHVVNSFKKIINQFKREVLFCDEEKLKNIKAKLSNIYQHLIDFGYYDEKEQFEFLHLYVEDMFELYANLFLLEQELIDSRLIQTHLIENLLNIGLELDTECAKISIFNPIVLQCFLLANEKFYKMCTKGNFLNMPPFYIYIYAMKTMRNLADLTFCDYAHQAVYKISEIETITASNLNYDYSFVSFPVRDLTNSSYYEGIDPSRLAEKIYYAIWERALGQEGRLSSCNCLISYYSSYGEEKKQDLLVHILKNLLNKRFKNNTYEINKYFTPASRGSGEGACCPSVNLYFIKPDKLLSEVTKNIYDVSFILDSMFLYGPFYNEALRDESNFAVTLKEDLNLKNFESKFLINDVSLVLYKNYNDLNKLFDRLSAMLLKPVTYNARLKLNVNEQIIHYLLEKARSYDGSDKIRMFYIYLSNNEAFSFKYRDYRFVRYERHNGKDVKVLRLAGRTENRRLEDNFVISNTLTNKIILNGYDFIKTYLLEEGIIENILNCSAREEHKIIDLLMNIWICLEINELSNEQARNIHISFLYNGNDDKPDDILHCFADLFSELKNDSEVYECHFLTKCMRKGLFYSVIANAKTYEEALIAYILNNKTDKFNILVDRKWTKFKIPEETNAICDYRYLHNVNVLIESFDGPWSSSAIGRAERIYWLNGRAQQWAKEIKGLIIACENIGYTCSLLYDNLCEYYRR